MSWSVNGRMYHNREEYERALAAYEKQARENLRQAQQAAARHQARIGELQGELRRAQGDMRRQIEIDQRIQTEVQGVARQQSRLESLQRDMDTRLTAALTEARREIGQNREQLQRVEQMHQSHVAETRQMFDAARREMAVGFADAERRRVEMGAMLQAGINAVEAKVEADRQARLRTQQDRGAQATLQIQIVEEQLVGIEPDAARLELDGSISGIRMKLAEARAQLANNATGSLAASGTAFAETRALVIERDKRDADLKALSASAAERLADVETALSANGVETYFKVERAAAIALVARQRRKLDQAYKLYGRRYVEQNDLERVLPELEASAADMVSGVPVVSDKVAKRAERFGDAIEAIASVYGPAEYADPPVPEDLKAPVTVNCVFGGGERVDITIDLDGTIGANAYRHGSQQSCEQKGARVTEALTKKFAVAGSVDPTNPQQATAASVERQRWESVGDRLRSSGMQHELDHGCQPNFVDLKTSTPLSRLRGAA